MTDTYTSPPVHLRPISRRARFGVIVPATNTVVEHDYALLSPDGVTNHAGRMYLPNPVMGDDEAFLALIDQIRASIQVAMRDVLTCEPDRMVMGMSAETFWNGMEGNAAFEQRIRDASGLEVSTGATACREALQALGATRIAAFSPYQPVADREVGRYFAEAGFEVARVTGLRCPTAVSISEVPVEVCMDMVRELDGDDIDAIVQVGTNLSFVRGAAEAEQLLGKPVLAINTATLWHALRHQGIEDQCADFGSLLRDH